MRVYENGKPARTPDYLRWRPEGPRAGDPVFVPGHPGSTSRLLTLEQLKFNRSVTFPQYIARNSELRGRMIEWGKTGDEPQRIVQETCWAWRTRSRFIAGCSRRCSTTD